MYLAHNQMPLHMFDVALRPVCVRFGWWVLMKSWPGSVYCESGCRIFDGDIVGLFLYSKQFYWDLV